MKYSNPLALRFARWAYHYIDRYEYGVRSQGAVVRAISDKEYAVANHTNNRRVIAMRRLRAGRIDRHLMNLDVAETVYYTSLRSAPAALLMVDIDAHEGEQDAQQVAEWIRFHWLKDCYVEPSTHGLGRHLYILVPAGTLPRLEINRRMELVASALAYLVHAEGWESKVCGIYGTYSIRSNSGFLERGRLAKLPRPQTEEQFLSLKTLPLTNWRLLGDIVNSAGAALTPPSAIPPIKCNTIGVSSDAPDWVCNDPDGFKRKLDACLRLSRELRRIPTPAELLTYYEENYLTTGPRDRERERQIRNTCEFVANTFDPKKVAAFAPGNFHEAIAKAGVSAEDMEFWLRGKRQLLTLEDLDAFLGIVTLMVVGGKGDAARASRERVMGYWGKLKAKGLVSRSLNSHKFQHLTRIALAYGLLELADAHVPPTRRRRGKGRLLVPGPNHPAHGRFALASNGDETR